MLEIRDLSAGYDAHDVVRDIDLDVDDGEAVAVVGANGAGKSTLLRAVCGLLTATSGSVRFAGDDVVGVPVHERARRGMAFVPTERHLFPGLSVDDHLTLGAYPRRPDPSRRSAVFDLFPRLADRRRQRAGTMSGGEQQMLAVGRALMSSPRLLVLDEPTTGLAPALAADAYAAFARLRTEGLTILVADQHVPLALGLADHGYVLADGRVRIHGSGAALRDDPDVRRAYLGIA